MKDGAPVFANARYVMGATEYDFWSAMDAGNRVGDLVAKNVTPLAEKTTFIDDGARVASGITAVARPMATRPGTCVSCWKAAGGS